MQNRLSIALAARSADAAVFARATPTLPEPDLRILVLDSSCDEAGFKVEPEVLHEKI